MVYRDEGGDNYFAARIGSVSGTTITFSTTDSVWCLNDDGLSGSLKWQVAAVPSPSAPLAVPGGTNVLVGGSDGRLYQIDGVMPTPGVTSVLLSSGAAAVGAPGIDVINDLIHVGSEAGTIHAVSYSPQP